MSTVKNVGMTVQIEAIVGLIIKVNGDIPTPITAETVVVTAIITIGVTREIEPIETIAGIVGTILIKIVTAIEIEAVRTAIDIGVIVAMTVTDVTTLEIEGVVVIVAIIVVALTIEAIHIIADHFRTIKSHRELALPEVQFSTLTSMTKS